MESLLYQDRKITDSAKIQRSALADYFRYEGAVPWQLNRLKTVDTNQLSNGLYFLKKDCFSKSIVTPLVMLIEIGLVWNDTS